MRLPALDDVRSEQARRTLLRFTTYTYPGYQVNWHHELIASHLDNFVTLPNQRLMVFSFPRSGKSELVSRRLPAYILGRDPDASIIATSYSASLASAMNRDVQRIIDSEEYRRLFPGTTLWGKNVRSDAQGSWLRNSDLFEVVGRRGYYLSTGVGGGITGRGANCLTGETKISTEKGDIAIQRLVMLQYHPRVWAFDHETNAPVLRRIVAVKESYSDDILEIVTVSGRSIRATSEHRFYVQGRGYQKAALLRPGDSLKAFALEQNLFGLRQAQGRQGPRYDVQGVLSIRKGNQGNTDMRLVRQGIRPPFVRPRKGTETRNEGRVLQQGMLARPSCGEERGDVPALRQTNAGDASPEVLFGEMRKRCAPAKETQGSHMSLVRSSIFAGNKSQAVLHQDMRECCSFGADAGQGQFSLQDGNQLRQVVCGDARSSSGTGQPHLCGLPEAGTGRVDSLEGARSRSHQSDHSPHQRRPCRQYPAESCHLVQDVSRCTPQVSTDTVAVVRRLRSGKIPVYDIQVEESHNFFAADVLTHNCIIIDDPVKNRKEANSATYRNAVWEWYTSTLYTRLAPGGSILLIVTRWHEDDLAGRLLAAAAADPHADQWTVVTLPAVAEEPVAAYDPRKPGDVLWPVRWDADEMRRKRAVVGERDWASLYQQRPAPDEGEIFKRHHWRYWQPRGAKLPPVTVTMGDGSVIEVEPVELPLAFDEIVQSWDLAFKDTSTSDFVAGMVLGRLGANKYLLDYINDRLDIVASMAAIEHWTAKWPKAIAKLIEDKANGPAVIQMMRNKVAGLLPITPEGGKISRAYAAQPEVQSGNVYLPHPSLAAWTNKFINNAAAFPNAAHDDDVDAFTQAIIRWQAVAQVVTTPAAVSSPAMVKEMLD